MAELVLERASGISRWKPILLVLCEQSDDATFEFGVRCDINRFAFDHIGKGGEYNN